jgi:DNA replication and repair protein RecF
MLTRLDIHKVRNLSTVSLRSLSRVNIFYGANGSGKTSLLEGIHFLGAGRSFRSSSAKSVVQHGADALTVYAEKSQSQGGPDGSSSSGSRSLGISRASRGALEARVDGLAVRSVAALAQELPILVFDAQGFTLLTGPPNGRRQFLDWGVFHVEHQFFAVWQRFQRALKQRNALLRRGKINAVELAGWTAELAVAGEALTAFREAYFQRLVASVAELFPIILPDCPGIGLQFRRGWERGVSYAEVLAAGEPADVEQGYTHSGPQRADVRILCDGHLASDMLSRGQQKLLVSALKLAQGEVFAGEQRGRDCLFLLDDLPAELDAYHLRLVCQEVFRLGAQVFITCIDLPDLTSAWQPDEDYSVFHVEQGRVIPHRADIAIKQRPTTDRKQSEDL